MLILRIGRKARWDFDRRPDVQAHVDDAAGELALRESDEGRLSVYRVEGEADGKEVAVRFALTCRQKAEPLDYVVFPAELVTALGLSLDHEPRENIVPYLSDRHFGISGLDEAMTRRLASAILAHNERRVQRIPVRDLDVLAVALLSRDPALAPYLRGQWPERLRAKR